MMLLVVFDAAIAQDPEIEVAMRADIRAHRERDPACDRYFTPFLFFKGYHALQAYRFAHYLWRSERRSLALYLRPDVYPHRAFGSFGVAGIGPAIAVVSVAGWVGGEGAVAEDTDWRCVGV